MHRVSNVRRVAKMQLVERISAQVRTVLKRHVHGIKKPFEVTVLDVENFDTFDAIFNRERGLSRRILIQKYQCDGLFPADWESYYAE